MIIILLWVNNEYYLRIDLYALRMHQTTTILGNEVRMSFVQFINVIALKNQFLNGWKLFYVVFHSNADQ